MNVKVGDRFARVRAVIDHKPVAALQHSKFCGNFLGCHQHAPQQHRVRGACVTDAGDRAARHNQDMDRGLGMNIVEREKVFFLVDHVGGNLARGDFFKDSHIQKGFNNLV